MPLTRRAGFAPTAAYRCRLIRRGLHRRRLLAQRSLRCLALQVEPTQKRLIGRDERRARVPQDRRSDDDSAGLLELGGSRCSFDSR